MNILAKSKPRCIGILTSGGDCQGLNAAIRGVAKTAIKTFGMDTIGIKDGFRGLIENRSMRLDDDALSGILTLGGTILGTSRDKPDKFPIGNEVMDMTIQAIENCKRMHLNGLVCIGGGGTQKNALKLLKKTNDIQIITLPKTIDNDVSGTDVTFGFDTAVQIATEAIDRVHSTASSHQRVMVVEIMGHNTGWLTAAAGLAGGADVVLIPELPYSIESVARDILERHRKGKRFSIVAVAEGATQKDGSKESGKKDKKKKKDYKCEESAGIKLTRQIMAMTGLEARLTTLGHTQRGGSPSSYDRILATMLGTKAAQLVYEGVSGVMVGLKGDTLKTVPLEEVAGKRKNVPLNHPVLESLRMLKISLGE